MGKGGEKAMFDFVVRKTGEVVTPFSYKSISSGAKFLKFGINPNFNKLPELSGTDLKVFMFVAITVCGRYNISMNGEKPNTNADISEHLKMWRQVVSRSISRLEELNMVARVIVGGKKAICVNPHYAFVGNSVFESIYDIFDGGIVNGEQQ